ncbi:MAG: EF-hand domain-containing protein [Maricaulaceae bacterium]
MFTPRISSKISTVSMAGALAAILALSTPALAQTLPDDGPIATNPVPDIKTDIKAASAADELSLETLPEAKRRPLSENKVQAIGPAGLLMASFERSGDYSISREEFNAGQSRAFTAADENGNGALTLFELNRWREAALGREDAAPGMIAFDSNYDQRITQTEFAQALMGAFRIMDKDEDGALSFAELLRDVRLPTRRAQQPKRESKLRDRSKTQRPGQSRRNRS